MSEYTGSTFAKFCGLVGRQIWLQMIDQSFIFLSLKRNCHGNKFYANWRKLPYPIFIIALTFNNRLENRNLDFRRLYGGDPSTSDKNLVSFRSVTAQTATLVDRESRFQHTSGSRNNFRTRASNIRFQYWWCESTEIGIFDKLSMY